MQFVTLQDVARAAGVSYATVDRVVNARGGVAQKSVLRVQEAIERLGYERDMGAANLARQRVYRFHFLLPDDSNDFFRALARALDRTVARPGLYRLAWAMTRVPAFSEAALIGALDALSPDEADCVGVVALDTPDVAAAAARAQARGIGVVTLVSDIAAEKRAHYVGIDNRVAGRTAGRMMGLAHGRQAGRVLPIIGASRAQDHHERLTGFREVLAEHFPAIVLMEPSRSRDEARLINLALKEAWAKTPDLTGVYNIGAGNEGLIDWVGTLSGTRPILLIHELSAGARRALETGRIDAVIDQKPQEIIDQAIRAMRLLSDGATPDARASVLTPAIYLPENLPTHAKEDRIPAA